MTVERGMRAAIVRHTQGKSASLVALGFIGWTAALCNAASVILADEQIASVIPAGEQITLRSEILGEDRTVFVALPHRIATELERYPVLYLTDAQWNFEQARGRPPSIWREISSSRK